MASGITGAYIDKDIYKRQMESEELAGSNSFAKRGLFDDLMGSLSSWLGGGGDDSAANTAAPAATTSTPAPAPATSTAPAPTSTTSSATGDSLWDLFPPFTWPGFGTKTSSASASTAAPASTYTPTTSTASTAETTGTTSTWSTPSETSDNDNGGGSTSEVVSYAEKGGGISYSPYTKDGQCKSTSQVQHDMNILSSYAIIRLYGTDCSGVENTLATMKLSQKLMAGMYNIDDSSVQSDLSTIKLAVEGSSRGWDAIDTIAVGNELVNFGKATPQQISNAIQTAKTWLKQNAPDFSGSVVSVDTLTAVTNNAALCDASDYIAVNCHPFWSGATAPEDSGSFLKQRISDLQAVCGSSKRILITESGWPTQGQNYGSCVPSKDNQLKAIKSIANALGEDVLMFTTYDDYWKPGGEYGVEKYWGIYGDPAA